MIKKTNRKLVLTVSEREFNWYCKVAKNLNISKSKVHNYLMFKNIINLTDIEGSTTEMQEIIRSAKIRWMKK